MEITSNLVQIDEDMAVFSVMVLSEPNKVIVYATALSGESGRYMELAQARALVLARQILEQGLGSVNLDDFVTPPIEQEQLAAKAQTNIPPVVIPPPTAPAVEPAITRPDAQPQQPDVTVSGSSPDPSSLPEVPW